MYLEGSKVDIKEQYLEFGKQTHNVKKALNAMKEVICDLSEQYILADEEEKESIARECFPFLIEYTQSLQAIATATNKQTEKLVEILMLLWNRRKLCKSRQYAPNAKARR